jgi:hypothetical protein
MKIEDRDGFYFHIDEYEDRIFIFYTSNPLLTMKLYNINDITLIKELIYPS